MQLLSILLTPVISLALAAGAVPGVRKLAFRCGALAPPTPDGRHVEPTPLLGGIAILAAMLVTVAVMGDLPWGLALGMAALLATGTVDDIIVLTPMQKLAAEIPVAAGVLATAGAVSLTPWRWLDLALALFWLLATTNSFNLVDGLDGLASGVGIVAALAIAVTALLHHSPALACWALALAGALGGFLLYNFRPASIFMGDGGALPVGLLLGMLSLRAGGLASNSRLTVYVFPVLVMLVPLLDTTIVSVARMATGRGVSRRGLDHSHHRLLSLGLNDQQVVLLCWAVTALGAALALTASLIPHCYLLATLPLTVLAVALTGLFMIDLTFDSRGPGATYGYVPRLARLILRASYQWRVVDVALDAVLITAAYFGAFLIRLDFAVTDGLVYSLIGSLPWVLLASYPGFFAAGVYRGMWRYIGLSSVIRFACAAGLAGILLLGMSLFRSVMVSGSIPLLFALLGFNLLVMSRMSFQLLRRGIRYLAASDDLVLIIGAGELGARAARNLVDDHVRRQRLLGFIDDDSFKQGKLVDGHPVLGLLSDLEDVHAATGFNRMLIAEPLDAQRLIRVGSFAKGRNIDVRRISSQVDEISSMMSQVPVRETLPSGTASQSAPPGSESDPCRMSVLGNLSRSDLEDPSAPLAGGRPAYSPSSAQGRA